MKKLFSTIMVLVVLFSTSVIAKTKSIGNGLSINVPNKYKYFELTFGQLVSRFPEIAGERQLLESFGVGMGAKLIVIANNQKTIKFFDDATSVTGLEKILRNHLQPIGEKIVDSKLLESVMKDIQNLAPSRDFENMSEEEKMNLMAEFAQSPKIIKKYERIFKPYIEKFNREYNFDKFTVLLVGDKKAEFLNEIKNKNIDELLQIVRDEVIKIFEETKNPSLKHWQFEIEKNHLGNLYLYSNDSFQSPYVTSKFYQELFLTSYKDQILLALSICVEKCNSSTDLLNIIKPSNLYVDSNSSIEVTDSSNLNEKIAKKYSLKDERPLALSWDGYSDLIAGKVKFNEADSKGTVNFVLPNNDGTCEVSYNLQQQGKGTWQISCTNNMGAAGTMNWVKNGSVTGTGRDYKDKKVKFTISQ